MGLQLHAWLNDGAPQLKVIQSESGKVLLLWSYSSDYPDKKAIKRLVPTALTSFNGARNFKSLLNIILKLEKRFEKVRALPKKEQELAIDMLDRIINAASSNSSLTNLKLQVFGNYRINDVLRPDLTMLRE